MELPSTKPYLLRALWEWCNDNAFTPYIAVPVSSTHLDVSKRQVTVLSRCLQFNLKQMPPLAITSHLAHILQAEGVKFELPALGLVARSAAGSMRDALSLLDQAIAHGAGEVQESQVRAMLGTVDLDYLYSILEAVQDGEAGELIHIAADMAVRSLSFGSALQELAALLTRLQIEQSASGTIDDDYPDRPRLLGLAGRLSPEFVQLAYQIAIQGRAELPLAPDEYSGFLMTLLRLHAFRPDTVADVVSAGGSSVNRIARNQVASVTTGLPDDAVGKPLPVVRNARPPRSDNTNCCLLYTSRCV